MKPSPYVAIFRLKSKKLIPVGRLESKAFLMLYGEYLGHDVSLNAALMEHDPFQHATCIKTSSVLSMIFQWNNLSTKRHQLYA